MYAHRNHVFASPLREKGRKTASEKYLIGSNGAVHRVGRIVCADPHQGSIIGKYVDEILGSDATISSVLSESAPSTLFCRSVWRTFFASMIVELYNDCQIVNLFDKGYMDGLFINDIYAAFDEHLPDVHSKDVLAIFESDVLGLSIAEIVTKPHNPIVAIAKQTVLPTISLSRLVNRETICGLLVAKMTIAQKATFFSHHVAVHSDIDALIVALYRGGFAERFDDFLLNESADADLIIGGEEGFRCSSFRSDADDACDSSVFMSLNPITTDSSDYIGLVTDFLPYDLDYPKGVKIIVNNPSQEQMLLVRKLHENPMVFV